MKLSSFLIAVVVFLTLSGNANAMMDPTATNYTTAPANMGDTHIGQWGTISGAAGFYDIVKANAALGTIPAHSAITFTFSVATRLMNIGTIGGRGSYDYVNEGAWYYGYANASDMSLAGPSMPFSYGLVNGMLSPSLIIATADITSPTTGIVKIINNSDSIAKFAAAIGLVFGTFSATYNVTGVPLPAALPLFAVGLAGLAAARSKKKFV